MATAATAQDRLLQAGLSEFASHGYSAASTRAIASAAGMPMSAITYHYGGKDGLYAAVVMDAARVLRDQKTAPIEAYGSSAAADPRASIKAILRELAQRLADPSNRNRVSVLAREHLDPSAAFRDAFDLAIKPILTELARLAAGVIGEGERARCQTLAAYLFYQQHAALLPRAACNLFAQEASDDTLRIEAVLVDASVDAAFDALCPRFRHSARSSSRSAVREGKARL